MYAYMYRFLLNLLFLIGFLKKEIEKADIHVVDTGENPEAPHPREMIDLEVSIMFFQSCMYMYIVVLYATCIHIKYLYLV